MRPIPQVPARAPDDAVRMDRAGLVLAGTVAALIGVVVVRLPLAWSTGHGLNHISSAWMTMADDLARGTFYRPLHDPETGFGGTRFFPLVFSLHALLLRLGVPVVEGAQAVSFGSAAILLMAAYLLLRSIGASRLTAAIVAGLTLAGASTQNAVTGARGDLLPVGLEAAALAVLAGGVGARGGGVGWRRLLLASLLLVLAFSAKPTSLTALAAAAAFLVLRRLPAAAAALAGLTLVGAVGFVLVTDALAGGRFLSILATCSDAGRPLDARSVLRGLLRLAQELRGSWPRLVLMGLAVLAAVRAAPRSREAWASRDADGILLTGLWLAAAVAGAVPVLASPGTGMNHLVEIEVAAALLLGASWMRPGGVRTGRWLPVLAAGCGLWVAASLAQDASRGAHLAGVRSLLAVRPPGRLLAEDPIVALVAGQRPVMMDAFMLRVASQKDPGVRQAFVDAVRRGDFAGVALIADLDAPDPPSWYPSTHFGDEAIAALRSCYRRAAPGEFGGPGPQEYFLYVPRACQR